MSIKTYLMRRVLGVCVICGEKDLSYGTKIMCLACKMDKRERDREWRSGKARNEANRKEYHRDRRIRAKENGLCTMCCKRKVSNGRSTCKICSSKANIRQKVKRDGSRISDGGGCPRCGKPIVPEYKVCKDCLPSMQKAMLYARSLRKEKNYFEESQRFILPGSIL